MADVINGEKLVQSGETAGDNTDSIQKDTAGGGSETVNITNRFVNGITADEYEERIRQHQAAADALTADNDRLKETVASLQEQYRSAFFGSMGAPTTQSYVSNNPAIYDNEKVTFGDIIK